MLHVFISGRPSQTRRQIRGLSASVVAHGALLAVALVATTSDRTEERARNVARVAERLVFTAVARPVAVASRSVAARARPRSRPEATHVAPTPPPTPPPAPSLDDVSFEVPDVPTVDVPGMDLAERASTGLAIAEHGLADMFAVALGRQKETPPNWNGVYTADVVEKIVAPYRSNPRPEYPGFLLDAGIEADVDVRFVVDSLGRVDARTVEFPRQVHHLFVAAVRRAVLRSRFLPAEVDGHRVPQLVAQRFSFVLAR